MNVTVATRIRVVQTTTTGFGSDAKVSTSIVWEGQDIGQLSLAYPPSQIFGADPLGRLEIEDGFIRFTYRFEKLEDGSWTEIDDPRVRSTPLTELEREIDAENRRRFPGDFVDECDYCGRSDCWGECHDDPFGYDDPPEPEPDYNCPDCEDHGCELCDPLSLPEYDCEDCFDAGCPRCRPHSYKLCVDCQQEHLPLNHDGELCDFCQRDRDEANNKPYCRSCGSLHTDPTLEMYELCADCDVDEDSYSDWDDIQPERRYRQLINRLLGIRKKNRR